MQPTERDIRPVLAVGDLRRGEVQVTFSKPLDPHSIRREHFSLEPAVPVRTAEPGDAPNSVRLSTGPLADGTASTLTVRDVQDRSPAPNRLATPARIGFQVHDASRPIVELWFNEGQGRTTANTGTSAGAHAIPRLTDDRLAWSSSASPGGSRALDFGAEHADRAVELDGGPVAALAGLRSFTLSGWINCRSARAGSGGNRIVTAIQHGGGAVGHFNSLTRPGHTDRMFRGLIDQIRRIQQTGRVER